GPAMRSRYACAAACGSISSAHRFATAAIAVMRLPMRSPKTCPTLEAGSVLTRSTRLPWAASCTAVAQAMEVLPTPPLPVKKRNRGGWVRKCMKSPRSAAAVARAASALGWGGFGRLDVSPAGQFAAVGIATGQGHLAIDQNQGQRLLARAFQKAFHSRVFGESKGLLCQVEAFDLSTVLFGPIHVRSEEHTSELQSRENLVCRLLLEKKKKS